MHRLIVVPLIAALGLFSCKKAGSGHVSDDSFQTVYNGLLTATISYSISSANQASVLSRTVSAVFSKKNTIFQSGKEYYPFDFIPVDSVRFNGIKLKRFDMNPRSVYKDTTGVLAFPPATWAIHGGPYLPDFTTTINDSVPRFTAIATLPDSLSISAGVSFPLGCVNGGTMIIDADDGIVTDGMPLYQELPASATSFSSHLISSSVVVNQYLNLTITCYADIPFTTGGKSFLFRNISVYSKSVKIVP